MARSRAPRASIDRHHAEWLSLVETSGPFLTVPALKRAMPDGLDALPESMPELRLAYAEYQSDVSLQPRWVRFVLDSVLGLAHATTEADDDAPTHRVAEHGVTVRPSYVVRDNGKPVLLVHRLPHGTAIDRPLSDDGWTASPIDRAAELARASEVPLALVTNGDRWTLVWARRGETTGTCTWRSEIWLEEPITLRAFVSLLGAQRFFTLPVEEGLARLLQESAGRQQEVADQLGGQVRHAVELLIATLDREDRTRRGELLRKLEGAEVYRGAVTVIMRLVFLFVAEERRLLPIDEPFYAETLAASTLRSQLRERADRFGEEILESSHAAWHRVLALFRAVHGGIEHDALRLPAYGGGLFDPDRYPFLEGRQEGTRWADAAAAPVPVDDRTMLHLLDALQTLRQGDVAVLLSYRSLDVEQIGHVYEGLLDHTALRITDTALGLAGKLEPEIALGDIDAWTASGVLVERLAKATGRSERAIEKALEASITSEQASRLRAVCQGDSDLYDRIEPLHGLLRVDLRGDPLVFPAGSLYVTQALDRRASGTYYTPRQLAEEVVQHALDPVAYSPGPAEEADPEKWRLKPSADLLDLKVADIAMGSGAFLVAACRYLAARVQEAWQAEGVTTFEDTPIPADPLERDQLAHRLVAERCLYGVDKNPMAVEMAKLSLWLITLAKDRPFSFVDHALRAGDSLLGITDLRQLKVMHMDPSWSRQSTLDLGFDEIEAAVDRALAQRRDLESFVVRDVVDAARKSSMLQAADEALDDARLLGDLVVGAALAQFEDADPLIIEDIARDVRTALDARAGDIERDVARSKLRAQADDWLIERRPAVEEVEEVVWADRHPFHWAIEFPEVQAQGGFDAIVGNPPFVAGTSITGTHGSAYREWLLTWLAAGRRAARCDLVAFFFLRARQLLRPSGAFGLIATNTIAQGDTREIGLERLREELCIYRAIASEPWPGGASLEMSTVWAFLGDWGGTRILDGGVVHGISASLTGESRVPGSAWRLAREKTSFEGWKPAGQGFVLDASTAQTLISQDPRNCDVVKPYMNGDDLNTRPDASPSRWVIDFQDWPEERAREYAGPFAHVQEFVKPERAKSNRAAHRRYWWRFGETRPGLSRSLRPLERCVVMALTSKVVQPVMVPTGTVFSHAIAVFAYDDDGHFGVLSSGFHWWWAVTRASTLETRVRYTPTDCFETFVQPPITETITESGRALDDHRTALMLDRQEGLTKTYNRVHNPDEHADDITRLREIHVALDYAVRDAYGWDDLDLGHDFHETKFGTRFTFAPTPRQEILDRLLELNHERYAEEVRQGLHAKAKSTKRKPKAAPAGAMTLGFDDV
jgi:hypothetical protein